MPCICLTLGASIFPKKFSFLPWVQLNVQNPTWTEHYHLTSPALSQGQPHTLATAGTRLCCHHHNHNKLEASQVVLVEKNLPVNAEDTRDLGSIPGSGRSPGVGNSNSLQYSCLEKIPGRLQSMGSQRAGHDWVTAHRQTSLSENKFTKEKSRKNHSSWCKVLLYGHRNQYSEVLVKEEKHRSMEQKWINANAPTDFL